MLNHYEEDMLVRIKSAMSECNLYPKYDVCPDEIFSKYWGVTYGDKPVKRLEKAYSNISPFFTDIFSKSVPRSTMVHPNIGPYSDSTMIYVNGYIKNRGCYYFSKGSDNGKMLDCFLNISNTYVKTSLRKQSEFKTTLDTGCTTVKHRMMHTIKTTSGFKMGNVPCEDNVVKPVFDVLSEKLEKAVIISSLDICNAYMQVGIPRFYSALFMSYLNEGIFIPCTLPIGAKGARNIMTAFLNVVLKDALEVYGKFILIRVDDILVATPNFIDEIQTCELHRLVLTSLLRCFQKFSIMLNVGKLKLFKEKLVFFGKLIDLKSDTKIIQHTKPLVLDKLVNYTRPDLVGKMVRNEYAFVSHDIIKLNTANFKEDVTHLLGCCPTLALSYMDGSINFEFKRLKISMNNLIAVKFTNIHMFIKMPACIYNNLFYTFSFYGTGDKKSCRRHESKLVFRSKYLNRSISVAKSLVDNFIALNIKDILDTKVTNINYRTGFKRVVFTMVDGADVDAYYKNVIDVLSVFPKGVAIELAATYS